MKNAMKKLLSLVLVAMLLVSVLPLGAMAVEGDHVDFVLVSAEPSSGWVAWQDGVDNTNANYVRVTLGADGKMTDASYATLAEAVTAKDFIGNGFVKWDVDYNGSESIKDVDLTAKINNNVWPVFNTTPSTPDPTPVTWTVEFVDARDTVVVTYNVTNGSTLAEAAAASGKPIENFVKADNYNIPSGYHYNGGWRNGVDFDVNAPVTTNHSYKVQIEQDVEKVTLCLEANGGTFSGNERTSASYDKGTVVDLNSLTAPTRSGYQFAGWYTDRSAGDKRESVTMSSTTTLYAHWIDVDAVTVTAVYYKNGVRMNSAPLLTWTIPYGENAFEYIYTHKDVIRERVPSGYTWGVTSSTADDYFYNYDNSEDLSAQNLTANGTKSVCVRFYSTSANTAKVQLYVHTKVGGTATIYEMKDYGYGYVLGDEVTRSQVEYVVKKNYTGSNMTIQGLYSDASWTELCNGKSPTAASGVEVTNANFKVHVIVKNATTAKADTSNPKTGDAIFAPVAVLTLSTAALAAVYFISKKRVVR